MAFLRLDSEASVSKLAHIGVMEAWKFKHDTSSVMLMVVGLLVGDGGGGVTIKSPKLIMSLSCVS